ncbi:hypothetical protein JCM11491_001821 [Sporobolomyces phaffii]
MSALLAALRHDDHKLGRLVRSTSGVSLWCDALTAFSYRFGDSIPETWVRKPGDVTEWYLDVLRACSRLEQVDVFFSTKRLCDLCLRALSSSFGSLNKIHFYPDPEAAQGTPLDLPTAFKIMRLRLPQTLAEATFDSLNWLPGSGTDSSELPFAVSNLTVSPRWRSSLDVLSFLPSPSAVPPLQSFDASLASGGACQAVPTLRRIAQRVGASLRKLHFVFPTTSGSPSLHEYRAVTANFHLPLDPAFPFPQLVHLALNRCCSLSLRFLESLASSSPLLETIEFYESSWTPDPGSTNLVDDERFEPRLIVGLRKFARLRSVALGTLPTVSECAYPTLIATFAALGVEVGFQTCVDSDLSEE